MLHFSSHFLSDMPKLTLLRVYKVVRQHNEGTMGSIIWIMLEIYLSFQQQNNFENPLRNDKIIAMSLVYYFFGTHCMSRKLLRDIVICN